MEEWKKIPEFPIYSVSDLGRVRNDRTGFIVAFSPNDRGIYYANMRRDKVNYRRSITRLVAEAFVPRPVDEMKDAVMQVNGDRSDNRAVNLAWVLRGDAVVHHRKIKKSGLDEK